MLIIFDCDGVLRSVSWPALYAGHVAIARDCGRDPEVIFGKLEDFKLWFNQDWRQNFARIGVRDEDRAVAIFQKIYRPHVLTFPWVAETLALLKERHTLAVLSANSFAVVWEALNGSTQHLEHVLGYEQVKMIKPHPEGIDFIRENVGANPDQTLMIGDSDVDILAGRNAGVRTAGVTWGLVESETRWAELAPDRLFRSPEELLRI